MRLRYRLEGDRYYVRIVDDVRSEAQVWRTLQMMGAPLERDPDTRRLEWTRYVHKDAMPRLVRAAGMMRASLEPEGGEAPVTAGRVGAAYAKARPVDVPALLKLAKEDPANALAALRAARTELAVWLKDKKEFAAEGRRDIKALDEALESLKFKAREAEREREKEQARELSTALRGVSAEDVWKAKTELEALKRRAEAFEKLDVPEVDLPEEIPGFRGKLRPYQRDGVRFLVARDLTAILADEMGLGKTVMTIAAVLAKDARALVVGPANVLYNWADEIERFADEVPLVYHQQRWIGNQRSRFLLTTYDALRMLDLSHPQVTSRDVLILDEAHYIRNPDTQRSKLVKQLPQPRRILLTGTPLVNTIDDYYELLEQVDKRRFTSRTEFHDQWTVDATLFNKYASVRNIAAEFLQRATRDVLLRRRKADVLTELPERIIRVQRHEMTPEQDRVYQGLETRALEMIREGKSDVAVFAAIHSLRHHLALARVDAVKERIDELLAEDEAIVVYSHYLEPLEKLHAQVEGSAMLVGATPPKRRQELARSFGHEGGPKVLLAQMEAGGIGLNFTAARYVLFVHFGWTPAVHAQAMDRVHRIGQDRTVFVEFFVTPNTIDERIAKILMRKEADQNLVLAEGTDLHNRAALERLLAEDAQARAAAEKEVAFS
ncbi:MAG TPA: DEAD/DEAH box helicase [Candidatus Thermoplasmatota archaeon]|nr:DEAD/DEAH box helicase [Candidatus Thermoplasmatota archaeon]